MLPPYIIHMGHTENDQRQLIAGRTVAQIKNQIAGSKTTALRMTCQS